MRLINPETGDITAGVAVIGFMASAVLAAAVFVRVGPITDWHDIKTAAVLMAFLGPSAALLALPDKLWRHVWERVLTVLLAVMCFAMTIAALWLGPALTSLANP